MESQFWRDSAQNKLRDVLKNAKIVKPIKNKVAKNLILFLGDGMSLSTVAATRAYIGGEADSLSFEKFTHFGLSKVSECLVNGRINEYLNCATI